MTAGKPQLRVVEAQPTIAIRYAVAMAELDLAMLYGDALPRLFRAVGERGHAPAGAPYGRYLEWGDRVVVEIGVPVDETADALPRAARDGELGASVLPGGTVAVLTHVGSYEGLAGANATLERWIDEQGFTRAGAPWESYSDDPAAVPESELRTDVVRPVRPRNS